MQLVDKRLYTFYPTWCIDFHRFISHYNLIYWRIITHGGIDGYSRLIVYLEYAYNNTASSTVYELILKVIQAYHLASQAQSDQLQSLENVWLQDI